MGERRENSVLFSLSELRRIEEDRVKQEESDRQARAAAELRARQDAERRVREEEEARKRQGEELAMRERLERERIGREEQLRLEEAERRARIEAEARLQEQRLHLEVQQSNMRKQPVKAVVGIVSILFLSVCGLGYYLYQQNEMERQRQALELAKKERVQKELQAQLAAETRRRDELAKEIGNLENQLASVKTEAERNEIKKRIKLAQTRLSAPAKAGSGSSGASKIRLNSSDSTDPIGGL